MRMLTDEYFIYFPSDRVTWNFRIHILENGYCCWHCDNVATSAFGRCTILLYLLGCIESIEKTQYIFLVNFSYPKRIFFPSLILCYEIHLSSKPRFKRIWSQQFCSLFLSYTCICITLNQKQFPSQRALKHFHFIVCKPYRGMYI